MDCNGRRLAVYSPGCGVKGRRSTLDFKIPSLHILHLYIGAVRFLLRECADMRQIVW